jgi:hypothetical protein
LVPNVARYDGVFRTQFVPFKTIRKHPSFVLANILSPATLTQIDIIMLTFREGVVLGGYMYKPLEGFKLYILTRAFAPPMNNLSPLFHTKSASDICH